MKKSLAIIIALAMILGMSQCKKKVETVTANELDGGVYITLKIIGEGRHDVNTATGRVKYSDGDVIYVGNDGKYCGMLTRTNGQFGGTIYPTNVDDYLHFYFVGGSTPSATPEVGATTSFTVNISNQSSNLPVLSYGKSNRLYTEGVTEYESFLLNKCGLVEFVLTDGTSESVTVADLQTEATISFANPDNAIAATGTKGTITLKSQSETSKWAILLPTSAAETTYATIADIDYAVDIPKISNNAFIHDNAAIEIPYIDYVFSVSSTKTVHFSPGNLQWDKANAVWRFAPNEFPAVNGSTTSGTICDKFSFGAWSGTPEQWDPYKWSTQFTWNGDEYFHGTINGHDDWFTLSHEQWQYIIDHSRWGLAKITNEYGDMFFGVVFLADNSTLTINEAHANQDDNQYTTDYWKHNMEKYGAVFIPKAGWGEYSNGAIYSFNTVGRYWTTTHDNGGAYIFFISGNTSLGTSYWHVAHIWFSVRLVR